MLNKHEKGFIEYWDQNRNRKKKVWRQLSVGLPLAVTLVITIVINIIARWHREAEKELNREDSSLIIVLIAACLLIVAFIVIFSAKHRWDQNEQYYKELQAKKDRP